MLMRQNVNNDVILKSGYTIWELALTTSLVTTISGTTVNYLIKTKGIN